MHNARTSHLTSSSSLTLQTQQPAKPAQTSKNLTAAPETNIENEYKNIVKLLVLFVFWVWNGEWWCDDGGEWSKKIRDDVERWAREE